MTAGRHTGDDGSSTPDDIGTPNGGTQNYNIMNNEMPTDPNDPALNSGAYVLNSLDQTERNEFDALLAESETTRDEVTELSDVAVLLGLAVEPVQPSPQLKSNIMSMLSSTPQLSRDIPPVRTLQTPTKPAVPGIEESDSDETADDADPIAITQTPSARKTQARWFNRPVIALTAVAAAIALIVGGAGIANVLGQTGYQQQQADQLAAITSADDMRQQAAPVSTGGTATLVWSSELGKSALIVNGVAALPGDKTYELWLIDADGNPTKAGLFDVSGSDREWRVLEGKIEAGMTVGVTVEPRGGSDAPTTDPIVAINAA